jgi:hypothetical protein
MKRTCSECGKPFETALSTGPCGLRGCPSAGGGMGKPSKTTARGRPIDDRKAKAKARRPAGGYVQQSSTGFDLLDACLPMVLALALVGGGLLALIGWGAVELVALLAVLAPW